MHLKFAISLLAFPTFAGACNCLVSRSACQEVANSNLVFIGTVEAVEPSILDPWQTGKVTDWRSDPVVIALRESRSVSALADLKKRYLVLFFDLPADEKLRIQTAESLQDLQKVINWIATQGTLVRFKVKQFVRQAKADEDDDDSSAKKEAAKNSAQGDKDNEKTPESLSVWNEPGSCGVPFQKGETYVVYATDDEETDRLATNICHRTARVSDAGDDLAYLYFNSKGAEIARVEGFVTSEIHQLQDDAFHYKEQIGSPVTDVVVELKSPAGARYISPDAGGRFVFDGIASGDYQLSVFNDRDFAKRTQPLAGPKLIHVNKSECALIKMLVLTAAEDR